MLDAEVEKTKFKQRNRPNNKFRDFTNPFDKKFKVNDPCKIDSLRPIGNRKLKNFMKLLDGKVKNKTLIYVKTCDKDVQWFVYLKTPGKWLDGEVRNFLFVSSLRFQ